MKKFLSILLMLMLVLSMSVVAFAEDDGGTYTATTFDPSLSNNTFTLKKTYTLTGGAAYPAETLTFTSTPDSGNPTTANLSVADLTVTGATNQTITITLPTYSTVGKWTYTITEVAGSAQAVTYDTTTSVGIEVLVTYDSDGKLTGQIGITSVDGAKNDTFTNKYEMGTLTVTKTISGDLASDSQYFDMTVTFTSEKEVKSAISISGGSYTSNPTTVASSSFTKAEGASSYTATANIKLKADDTLTFSNIPAGVTYTVVEADAHAVADTNGSDTSKGYTVTYMNGTVATNNNGKDIASGTISKDTTSSATINNYKQSTSNTGIMLDSMPYVIMLAVAAVGVVMMLNKKRSREF